MLPGFTYSALALVVFPLTFALPISERGMYLTAAQVQAVAPKSSSCDNAPAAGQCRTAAQAAPAILNSFNAFGIASPGERAAVLGIMAFESGDFKYDTPIVPTPGKGTRNMQSADFNQKYAMSIPGLAPKVAAVANDADAIRGLLTSNDYYDFGSGAWFLATQCTPAVRSVTDRPIGRGRSRR